MTKPLSPEQVTRKSKENFPSIIFETFNKLLIKKASPLNDTIIIKQSDVLQNACGKGMLNREDIFDNHWLDVETYYEEVGWKVQYCKPPYFGTGEPYFTFKNKKDA